jgi:hypothetical protein
MNKLFNDFWWYNQTTNIIIINIIYYKFGLRYKQIMHWHINQTIRVNKENKVLNILYIFKPIQTFIFHKHALKLNADTV